MQPLTPTNCLKTQYSLYRRGSGTLRKILLPILTNGQVALDRALALVEDSFLTNRCILLYPYNGSLSDLFCLTLEPLLWYSYCCIIVPLVLLSLSIKYYLCWSKKKKYKGKSTSGTDICTMCPYHLKTYRNLIQALLQELTLHRWELVKTSSNWTCCPT